MLKVNGLVLKFKNTMILIFKHQSEIPGRMEMLGGLQTLVTGLFSAAIHAALLKPLRAIQLVIKMCMSHQLEREDHYMSETGSQRLDRDGPHKTDHGSEKELAKGRSPPNSRASDMCH